MFSLQSNGFRARFVFLALLFSCFSGYYLCSISTISSRTVQNTEYSPQVNSSTLPSNSNYLALKGLPTAAFRDNLLPGVKYITAWPGAGLSNDVILFANLIYLAIITERIPVIPVFTPVHIEGAPPLDFGDVFDLARLQREIGKPVLEWRHVKDRHSESLDDLGCWNLFEAVQTTNTAPHWTIAPQIHNLDISYTTAPSWIKVLPGDDGDPHASFWSLAALSFPEGRSSSLQTPALSPIHKLALPPDDHMLCFDNLYYVSAFSIYEFEHDFGPAWRFVGRYMHWTPKIQQLANDYVRQTLDVATDQPLPNYITVHVRHGDFGDQCGEVPISACFAPLSVIARRVEEVKAEILHRKGIVVDRVIMTSDEKSSTWWDDVRAQGWSRPDHSRTAELHGLWYPVLIDLATQSGGLGFVGTWASTVSFLAANRVSLWQDGATRMVRWGRPGADDH
ncbi:hypothetical protein C8J57DRAFT_751130 [Mycena rebaudengoi]|nr:hypothetical protein C8J57DRAFT_751130 [Mycena rebaudengoi]